MATSDGEMESRLAHIWSDQDYLLSSPEVIPTQRREKGDVMNSVRKLGVPLFGMAKDPVLPRTLAKPEVETLLLDTDDEGEYNVEQLREEFLNHKSFGNDSEIIRKESRRSALRRKEEEEAARREDESEVESEDDINMRSLPRTDSARHSVLPTAVAAPRSQTRKEKRRRKRRNWFRRRKRAPKVVKREDSEAEEESERTPIMRTDTRSFQVNKQQLADFEEEVKDETEEELMRSAPVFKAQTEEDAGLETEADGSNAEESHSEIENDDEEDEVDSEAEVNQLKKRESGADRIAAFLDAEQKKRDELQSESEDEEVEEGRENALQQWLRMNEGASEVEDVEEAEEKGPSKYQQFLGLAPPHEDELMEQEEEEVRKEEETRAMEKMTKPAIFKVKSKRISQERKELKERKVVSKVRSRFSKPKRASNTRKAKDIPKSSTKRKSKRRSGKRKVVKAVPEGYYEKSVVKPTNVSVAESPLLTVQVWFSAFVALLVTFFTFLKAKALGDASVQNYESGRVSGSRNRSRPSESRRKSLK